MAHSRYSGSLLGVLATVVCSRSSRGVAERCLQSRGVWGPAPGGAPAARWGLTLRAVCSLFSPSRAVARPRPSLGPQGPASSYKAFALLRILSELFRGASHMSMCRYSNERSNLWPKGGSPGGASGEEPGCQCKRHQRRGFDPWLRKSPRGRAGPPTPGLLPGDSH